MVEWIDENNLRKKHKIKCKQYTWKAIFNFRKINYQIICSLFTK